MTVVSRSRTGEIIYSASFYDADLKSLVKEAFGVEINSDKPEDILREFISSFSIINFSIHSSSPVAKTVECNHSESPRRINFD